MEEKSNPNEDIGREIEETSKVEPVVTHEIAEQEEEIAEHVAAVPITRDELEERKEKVIKFLKNKQIWVVGILIMALILGIYIRSMPMHDHGGNPGLWDITTNTWTLGPDLDPWLFTRYAKTMVEEGPLPETDMMRNIPLGFRTSQESQLLPYMIAGTYYFFNTFSFGVKDVNVEFAAVIFPVIMFALTIITFFLFVREVFIRKDRKSILNANLIALISTFFMIVIPTFLSRTIAGIPEKESAAFFFMFLTCYLFLKAWKSEKIRNASVFAILAGVSTVLMGLIWGGVIYLFIVIALSSLVAFIINKVDTKEFIVYLLWAVSTFSLLPLFTTRYSLMTLVTSISSGLAFVTLLIFIVHFTLKKTSLNKLNFLKSNKLPENIISLIIAIILLVLLSLLMFGPDFIFDKLKTFHQTIFKPITGRWNITVAENRQPFFTEWASSFGPFFKGIPLLFWSFIIGSIVLFKEMLKKIKRKDSWVLTGTYTFFLFGLIFSRYSSSSLFNGENFISKTFYYLSALILIGSLLYYYNKYHQEGNLSFQKISYEYIFLFSLFLLSVFSARGAVRLIMVLGPIAPIFLSYLIVKSINKFRKSETDTQKLFLGLIVLVILVSSIFTFWTFYKTIKIQAYNFVPSHYNQQWQKAMEWTRENTPEDAVFGHWWDYGYWVQSIGNRATVVDGGNAITYWNYLMGRHVLTGDNQKDALEFLYNHNTTHFLIDSTDIGKYGAFSSIGSDKDFDRYSWIGTFLLDEKQTFETKNQTLYAYTGGLALDEDLIIEEDGKEILLSKQKAGVGAIILPVEKDENGTEKYSQPHIIVFYQNKQYNVDLRYLSISGEEFYDFGSGIEAAAYIFPKLEQKGQQIASNPRGAAMFISPRLFRGMLSRVYILNDPLEDFPNFELVHTEQSLLINSLNSQGMNLPDFVYYQGLQGPIKIWEISYTGEEKIKEEYLDTDPTKYLDWKL